MARIGVIGGTGALGQAIAKRLAKAGHEVTIGSRNPEGAIAAAATIGAARGTDNFAAARDKDIVIVTVPYSAHASTLEQIREHLGGAIVVDATVPLVPPKVMRVQLPQAGSAAAEARDQLGPDVRLVTAFHSVAAHKLILDEPIDCDVLVFSDDVEARGIVIDLCEDMGLRGLAGGALINSTAAEALTSILIYLNKTYSADGAGIRFTGLKTTSAYAPGSR